mgnify:FL=1
MIAEAESNEKDCEEDFRTVTRRLGAAHSQAPPQMDYLGGEKYLFI